LSGATNPQNLTITGNATVTADFIPIPTQYYLTTAVSPAAGGSISPASGYYASGSVVTISATPAPGYQFAGFTGALSGTANPQNLTITGNASVTATFTPVPPEYYLTTAVSPPGGGSISPASGYHTSGSVVTVTATPAIGYYFSGFTGALTGGANPQNLTITGNATVTANFTTVPPPPDFTPRPAGLRDGRGRLPEFVPVANNAIARV
jgi:hypothetical protein